MLPVHPLGKPRASLGRDALAPFDVYETTDIAALRGERIRLSVEAVYRRPAVRDHSGARQNCTGSHWSRAGIGGNA